MPILTPSKIRQQERGLPDLCYRVQLTVSSCTRNSDWRGTSQMQRRQILSEWGLLDALLCRPPLKTPGDRKAFRCFLCFPSGGIWLGQVVHSPHTLIYYPFSFCHGVSFLLIFFAFPKHLYPEPNIFISGISIKIENKRLTLGSFPENQHIYHCTNTHSCGSHDHLPRHMPGWHRSSVQGMGLMQSSLIDKSHLPLSRKCHKENRAWFVPDKILAPFPGQAVIQLLK